MAQGDNNDIFMKFVLNGTPVAGESRTVLAVAGKPRNVLLNGFTPGFMFEIDSFAFSVGIDDDNSGADGKQDATNKLLKDGLAATTKQVVQDHRAIAQLTSLLSPEQRRRLQGTGGRIGQPPQPLGGFKAWRSGNSKVKYPVSVQPITITRPIDKASTQLLQYCIDCTSFDSATVVKRKSAGSPAAGEAYLRMDFVGVLIQDIAWSNEDPVKETTKIISRSITVHYRPQLPDGSLGAIKTGFWSMLPWETEFIL